MAQEMAYSHTYTIINIDLIELYIWSIISSPLKSESVSRSVMSNSVTPWVVDCQAPLSMEFSRQEY